MENKMAKRRFWRAEGRGYSAFYAVYDPDGDRKKRLYHRCSSGAEREAFIREQSELIRKFETEQEYLDFFNFVSTLTAD